MWSYVQMLSPLLTIALAAAICFGVVSYMMGQAKSRSRRLPAPFPRSGTQKENTFQSMTICRRVAQVAIRYLRCLLACWGSSFSLCYTPRQLDFRTY
jgi:hypothetical protein